MRRRSSCTLLPRGEGEDVLPQRASGQKTSGMAKAHELAPTAMRGGQPNQQKSSCPAPVVLHPGAAHLSAMKQIVAQDLHGGQIEVGKRSRSRPAQRWIADGDALPRDREDVDLTDFPASVRLREVFKSERKRVDSSGARRRRHRGHRPRGAASLAGPRPSSEPKLSCLSRWGRSSSRSGSSSSFARSARARASKTTDGTPRGRRHRRRPGRARETDGDWRDPTKPDGPRHEDGDPADAEAKAMARMIRGARGPGEVEKVVRPPRPGMPPDRIDNTEHHAASWMRRRLRASSAGCSDLGPSFARRSLATSAETRPESAWRPVARGGCAAADEARDRFLGRTLPLVPRRAVKVAPTRGRYRDKPRSTPCARAPRELPRPRHQVNGRDDLSERPSVHRARKRNGCQCGRRTTGGILPFASAARPFCRAPRVVDPLFHKESLYGHER